MPWDNKNEGPWNGNNNPWGKKDNNNNNWNPKNKGDDLDKLFTQLKNNFLVKSVFLSWIHHTSLFL